MTVEDVFQLDGRGTLITGNPGLYVDLIERGAYIELHTTTDTVVVTSVADFERMRACFSENRPRPIAILLTDPHPSDELPRGTKVYHIGGGTDGIG